MQRIGEDVSEKLDYVASVFIHGRAPRPRQVSLRAVQGDHAAARRGPRDRQEDPDGGPAGPGAGGQVCRPPAAVPPGVNLRARRIRPPALNLGAVGGQLRRAAVAAGLRIARRRACARLSRRLARDIGQQVFMYSEIMVKMTKT